MDKRQIDFDTTEASELAHRLREWVSPITKASWALDSALHNLRVANERGTAREIGDALMAAIIAKQAAAQIWEATQGSLVRAANVAPKAAMGLDGPAGVYPSDQN